LQDAGFPLPQAGLACRVFRHATAEALSKVVFVGGLFHEAATSGWQLLGLY
jgi:hypothetical protein